MAEAAAISAALTVGEYAFKFIKSHTTKALEKKANARRQEIFELMQKFGDGFAPEECKASMFWLERINDCTRDEYTWTEARNLNKQTKEIHSQIQVMSDRVMQKRLHNKMRLGSLHAEGHRSQEDILDSSPSSPASAPSQFLNIPAQYEYVQSPASTWPPWRHHYDPDPPHVVHNRYREEYPLASSSSHHTLVYTDETGYEYQDEPEPADTYPYYYR